MIFKSSPNLSSVLCEPLFLHYKSTSNFPVGAIRDLPLILDKLNAVV